MCASNILGGFEPWGLRQMTLTVTERCNQRCGYCYVDTEGGGEMTRATAGRALDLLFQHAAPTGTLTVSFFGGEPFLVPARLREIAEDALARAPDPARLAFAVTTNATALTPEGLAFVREYPVRVGVSFDGHRGQRGRPLADGGRSEARAREGIAALAEAVRARGGESLIGRMTVTPGNVAHLAENVRTTFSAGLGRILFLPDIEVPWDARALDRWEQQQRRLATWIVGREGAGRPVPRLMAWEGVLARLRGAPRAHCGAGVTQVAVATDGRIYPCYRSLYDPRREQVLLGTVEQGLQGTVEQGLTGFGVRERFAELDPERPRPEVTPCASCDARDGCGFFCPAVGHLSLGDPAAVPEVACALTRIQVAVCRPLVGARPLPARSGRRRASFAAAASAAVLLGGSLLGCDRSVGTGLDRDAAVDSGVAPGLCPVLIDAGDDATIAPGLCMQRLDAGDDASILPGICDIQPDAGEDSGILPGLCPVGPDAGQDAMITPGLCMQRPDAGEDAGIGPGLCPYTPDGGGTPGLC